MHTTPATAPAPPTRTPRPRTPRAWAWTGVAAGALAMAGIQASMAVGVNWEAVAGDPDAIVADLGTRTTELLVFHTATIAAALLVLVFAAGLKRRLDAQAPAGSLVPTIAGWGLVLVSVAGLLGTGLDTQFIFGFAEPDLLVASSGAFYSDWVATIPWLWVGAGVTGVALGVAALKHGAAPTWIGIVGLVLGGITLLAGVSPLQYLAGFTGPLWLLVTALGFALGDRR
ncbi:hypothetical protein [Isoptericola dokdonensis]|uniref:DUF4386 domain-containing protein n=1 Tax=Isoptericola dokdonensis DS-3 TaxID=1300344 RepID=A0A161IEV3_9MICO|nr:hypothetical protein [Isoptericola dokdonensis]ANC31917.1 hypothetical protein I598_2377 [Isoptericola dokdonensis DS-3]